jgi:uncharacterized protein (DUF1684 family)
MDLEGKPWIALRYQPGSFTVKQLGSAAPVLEGGDGQPVEDGASVPAGSVLVAGQRSVRAYEQEGKGILILHDGNVPALRSFRSLAYFEPNGDLRVKAKLRRPETPSQESLPTSLERKKTFYRLGTLELVLGGQELRLACHSWDPQSRQASVFFRDATSGQETYGGGRYLDVSIDEADEVVVDFNRAYNPYCAYTDAYNCPIPPKENSLSVPIRAGEKAFEHHP